jgi:glycosyltransferase involved in cell wall biosynthesis
MAYRLGFVMEQTLGHVTHAKNLQYWIDRDTEVIASWIPVSYEVQDKWNRIPLVRNNWTVKASLRAREQVIAAMASAKLDGLFYHTPVTAMFSHGLMADIPTVVSMDATPVNFDNIGSPYNHRPSSIRPLEVFKNAVNRRAFRRSSKLITWCKWAKDSLEQDYGIDPGKVVVIPPGVDLEKWKSARGAEAQRPVKLLFVGGDFRRKGGETLLQAFRDSLREDCELDIVTREPVDVSGLDNVRVHHGLGPNTPELMALYARADIFAFPTLGDVLPLAIMEAMASGLPVITTAVGAVSEQIEHGVTGFLIPPADASALAEAILRLIRDPLLRGTMSAAARRAADLKFNAATNYRQVLAVCKECVDAQRQSRQR